ncbi:SulP family inorganic anion transporter [Hellea balneolensis]|uniref:SulP family inorganic anion transporter n=1 Tax=Hellea balneolensis TaxID=287478 RepID=UPI00040BA279|nr:sulfate permease [Hellea balneolensis]
MDSLGSKSEKARQSPVARQWGWLKGYNGGLFTDDLVAAIIVTILLVPQSLAYALLAGLPPQVGIYVSIFPLLVYAAFGSSRYLNVGPTAVISLMTAAAIATLPEGTRLISAAALAVMTGGILLIAGLLKAGFVMNFVSRPVVSAYITGAALLIIFSQLKHIFGITASGNTVFALLGDIWANLPNTNIAALEIGLAAIIILWGIKKYFAYALIRLHVKSRTAKLIGRMAPIVIVAIFIAISAIFNFTDRYDVRVVGTIPSGLPPFSFPMLTIPKFQALLVPAIVIAIVAFVDSTSTAQELAARARNRIDSNKELLGLGASNIVAGLSGGYPINGSMSRSAVNFSAGGQTQIVGLLVAAFMALTAVFLTPVLKALPLAVLAALIIVACFGLLDFKSLWRTWIYSRADGITALATFLAVLLLGVQWGVLAGVVLAMALHISSTLQPHMPLVGRFPGTEHYRDAERFNVETNDVVKTLRIDESLYYANARYLEDKVARVVAYSPDMTDLVLMCTAVNRIDASALSSLEEINKRLRSAGISLHFSDMQSRVKERLFRSNFLDRLSGQIFLSQHEAMEELEPDPDWAQFSDHIDIH